MKKVEFTEAELMIMAQLAYANQDGFQSFYTSSGHPIDEPLRLKDANVIEVLEEEKNNAIANLSEAAAQNYIVASDSLKQKLTENEFVISKAIWHNTAGESGFAVLAIEPEDNPGRECYVIPRGSDSMGDVSNLNDWIKTNLALAFAGLPQQHKEMEEFLSDFAGYENINLLGHSLGGNLAMHGAITFCDKSKIGKVYSYNSPGFNAEYHILHRTEIQNLFGKAFNYQNEMDIVSSCLIPVGAITILETLANENILDHHSLWATAIADGSKLISNNSQSKNAAISAITASMTNYLSMIFLTHPFRYAGEGKRFFENAAKAVGNEINYRKYVNSHGYRFAQNSKVLRVDTDLLKRYSERIFRIKKQLEEINRDLSEYCEKVQKYQSSQTQKINGVPFGAYAFESVFLYSSYQIKGRNILQQCQNYLNETARDFEEAEARIRFLI